MWIPRNHTQRSLLAVHMHNVKRLAGTVAQCRRGSRGESTVRMVVIKSISFKTAGRYPPRPVALHDRLLGNPVTTRSRAQLMLNSSAEGAGRSEPAKEMDIFSNSNPEGAVTSPPISISIKREDEQTAVTKRVRFVPVAPLDEGDVQQLCGISGCHPKWNSAPTRHAPHPAARTPHGPPPSVTHRPPSAAHTPQHHTARSSTVSPHPTLSRARLSCPLSWNHAGICSVEAFAGRTRRVRDKVKPPVGKCR